MLEIFSSNLLNDFPNIFRFLVDDECGEIRPKFAENDLSCQFISNCGQLIFIALLLALLKFGLFILKNAMSTREGFVDTKWGVRVGKIYDSFGKEFFVTIMDMFQLDLYLGIYLQMDDFQIRSRRSLVNITVAMVTFALLFFSKIYLFFISTRVAIVRDERNSANKGYRKEYVEYEFMNEDMKCDSWFSKHYLILNLIKDAFVALMLVFFSTSGFLQVGSVLVIMAVFLGYQLFKRPLISAESQLTAALGYLSYTGIMFFFMVLVMAGKNMSTNTREYFVGIPLIILTSSLIIRVFFVNIRNSFRSVRKCMSKKNKVQDSQKNPEDTPFQQDNSSIDTLGKQNIHKNIPADDSSLSNLNNAENVLEDQQARSILDKSTPLNV